MTFGVWAWKVEKEGTSICFGMDCFRRAVETLLEVGALKACEGGLRRSISILSKREDA